MSDLLLAALGAHGEMGLKMFDGAFTELCLNGTPQNTDSNFKMVRGKAVRFLDALGDCEFDFEKHKVYPCPPSLVKLPGGGVHRTVLTGVRNPELTSHISRFVSEHSKDLALSEEKQSIYDFSWGGKKEPFITMPSTIIIEGLRIDLIKALATECNIQAYFDSPAAWMLTHFSVGLTEYRKWLVSDRCRDDELTWARRDFSLDTLTFKRNTSGNAAEGLVEYTNPWTNQRSHYLWVGDAGTRVDRDWGRYLALFLAGRRVTVYDERQQIFIVPASLPLPRFLARAATLCSGRIPSLERTGDYNIGDIPPHTSVDVYSGVPPEYSFQISEKLGQRSIVERIRFDKGGLILV